MLSEGGYVMLLGIFLGVAIIAGSVWAVHRMLVNTTQEILVKFILLVFTSLVGLYIVDKLIAFKINLMDEDQNRELFELIKTLVLMIFSYYFGTKSENSK